MNAGVEIPEYKDVPRPEGVEFVEPQVKTDAHAADLGMRFYTGNSFPEEYRGGIFSAQHGSWNRNPPAGYRVVFIPFREGRPAGDPIDFVSGFLQEAEGKTRGRPVGVTVDPRGALIVADDLSNTVWRVAPSGTQTASAADDVQPVQ